MLAKELERLVIFLVKLFHFLGKRLLFQGFDLVVFLLTFGDRGEELLDDLLLVLLLVVCQVVVLFGLLLLEQVVVLYQHVKVEPNHQKQTIGLFLFNDLLPTLLLP